MGIEKSKSPTVCYVLNIDGQRLIELGILCSILLS